MLGNLIKTFFLWPSLFRKADGYDYYYNQTTNRILIQPEVPGIELLEDPTAASKTMGGTNIQGLTIYPKQDQTTQSHTQLFGRIFESDGTTVNLTSDILRLTNDTRLDYKTPVLAYCLSLEGDRGYYVLAYSTDEKLGNVVETVTTNNSIALVEIVNNAIVMHPSIFLSQHDSQDPYLKHLNCDQGRISVGIQDYIDQGAFLHQLNLHANGSLTQLPVIYTASPADNSYRLSNMQAHVLNKNPDGSFDMLVLHEARHQSGYYLSDGKPHIYGRIYRDTSLLTPNMTQISNTGYTNQNTLYNFATDVRIQHQPHRHNKVLLVWGDNIGSDDFEEVFYASFSINDTEFGPIYHTTINNPSIPTNNVRERTPKLGVTARSDSSLLCSYSPNSALNHLDCMGLYNQNGSLNAPVFSANVSIRIETFELIANPYNAYLLWRYRSVEEIYIQAFSSSFNYLSDNSSHPTAFPSLTPSDVTSNPSLGPSQAPSYGPTQDSTSPSQVPASPTLASGAPSGSPTGTPISVNPSESPSSRPSTNSVSNSNSPSTAPGLGSPNTAAGAGKDGTPLSKSTIIGFSVGGTLLFCSSLLVGIVCFFKKQMADQKQKAKDLKDKFDNYQREREEKEGVEGEGMQPEGLEMPALGNTTAGQQPLGSDELAIQVGRLMEVEDLINSGQNTPPPPKPPYDLDNPKKQLFKEAMLDQALVKQLQEDEVLEEMQADVLAADDLKLAQSYKAEEASAYHNTQGNDRSLNLDKDYNDKATDQGGKVEAPVFKPGGSLFN